MDTFVYVIAGLVAVASCACIYAVVSGDTPLAAHARQGIYLCDQCGLRFMRHGFMPSRFDDRVAIDGSNFHRTVVHHCPCGDDVCGIGRLVGTTVVGNSNQKGQQ